jgi:hypothetical protein
MVDAVDAPLGPEEIQQLLMHATLVLNFGAAAAKFGVATTQLITELKKLLLKSDHNENPQIVVADAKTDAKIVAITQTTNPEKASEAIKNAMIK